MLAQVTQLTCSLNLFIHYHCCYCQAYYYLQEMLPKMCSKVQGEAIFTALSVQVSSMEHRAAQGQAVVTLLLNLLTDAACEDPAAVLMQELMLPICKARLEAAAGLLVSCHCSDRHIGSMFKLHAWAMRWEVSSNQRFVQLLRQILFHTCIMQRPFIACTGVMIDSLVSWHSIC